MAEIVASLCKKSVNRDVQKNNSENKKIDTKSVIAYQLTS